MSVPSISTRPEVGIVEPGQQLHERGLAAAVGADDRDGFASADIQVYAAEDRLFGMVVEADVFELERPLQSRERHRFCRVEDGWLAVHHFVDAVGGGDGLLDVAELAGESAGRVAHAGEHREEDAHIAVREGDVADLDTENVRVLAEDEVAAHHRGDEDDREAEGFDDGADERIVRRDAHLAVVVVFGRLMELVALGRLHGERLDELDAAERFGERFVNERKLLHGFLVGALERLAEPMDGVAGGGSDQDREQQQPPADPGGHREAHDDLERFEQGLAEQPLDALADRVEVGRAAVHEVATALLGEVGHVEPEHAAVEVHPQIVAE